jgi:hypothetical protein
MTTMKPVLKLAVPTLMLLLSLSLLGHGVGAAIVQGQDSIDLIRRQYAAINQRASKYRRVRKELAGFSLEGGELTAYFDGPAIVKIVATHYGEMGRTQEEYYFERGKLIFAFAKVFHYARPMSGKVVRTTEDRYYFRSDRLIRWVDENGKQVDVENEESQSRQKGILESVKLFTSGAKSRTHRIER